MSALTPEGVARADFFGRVKELHRLREALRSAIEERHRRAAILLGAPGIGKSRLLEEFLETAEEHVDKVTILSASCRVDGGPPYGIFRKLLMQRFYVPAEAPAEAARDAILQGCCQVLRDEYLGEEAAHVIGHVVGLPWHNSAHVARFGGDDERLRDRAIALFTQVVRMDATRVPIVLAVDNLHCASDESIHLFLRLAHGLNDAPVLFLAAARPAFTDAQRLLVDGLRSVGEVIEVVGLADRDCRRIVASLLAPADDLPEDFVRVCCEKALGNPLQLEQIVRLQLECGALERSESGWIVQSDRLVDAPIPSTLREVVRAKIARLGTLERAVLEKAAVIGDTFWVGCIDVLRRADEGSGWEESDRYWNSPRRTDELILVLNDLRRRDILLFSPTSTYPATREFAFKHSLEREMLYESVEGPRRIRYHRLSAQWLEAVSVNAAPPVDVSERIATHWERGHSPRRAATHFVRAAEHARAGHANAKAIGFLRRAMDCLGEDDTTTRIEVFHLLGRLYMTMGDHSEALSHFQEMLRIGWLMDDARHGGLAYNKMGQCYRALGEYDLALSHFKNGLALFRQTEDVRGIAMTADDIGRVFLARGDLERAMERFQEGLRLRRFLGDDRSVAVSLQHIGGIYAERGDFREAVSTLREALELARRCADRKTIADNLNNLAVVCFQRGEHDKAEVLWTEALGISRELGERNLEGMLLTNMGETSLICGRLEESRDRLLAAIELLEQVGDRRSLAEAHRNLGSVHLRMDDYARALEHSQRALEIGREVGARTLAALADRNLGEVYSRTLYDDLAERDARIERAAGHFAASIEALESAGSHAELGKSMLAHGAFLAELGRVEAAQAELMRARELFVRLDMRDSLERADRILSVL